MPDGRRTGFRRSSSLSERVADATLGKYPKGRTDPLTEREYVVVRRCSSFEVSLEDVAASSLVHVAAQTTALRRSTKGGTPKDEDPNGIQDMELGEGGKKSAEVEAIDSKHGDAEIIRREVEQSLASRPDVGCAAGAAPSYEACKARRDALDGQRDERNDCDLPSHIPWTAILNRYFCADAREACEEERVSLADCLKRRALIDEEIDDCDACINEHAPAQARGSGTSIRVNVSAAVHVHTGGGPGLAGSFAQTAEADDEGASAAAAMARKQDVLREQERRRREERRQWWIMQERELYSADGTSPSLLEVGDSRANLTQLGHESGMGLVAYFRAVVSHPSEGVVVQKRDTSKTLTALQKLRNSKKVYDIEIPCFSLVGPGLIELEHPDGSIVKLPKVYYVLFNPYEPEEKETYMPGEQEQHEFLAREDTSIWRGPNSMIWRVGQFEHGVLTAVMKLASMIPWWQRNQAPRVTRWFTYLLNNQVLRGNWCQERGCMKDAVKKPWEWTGSVDIYEEWLRQGSIVKYGQCWVFAGILVSALRSLGVGSVVVTNYNSAHGRPPYNMGIDDFDAIGERNRPVRHRNTKESIWNFHVWNEAWMQRYDLHESMGTDGDGWQVLDSTPQEMSCELRRGEQTCRAMMGPAPKAPILRREMNTKGGETKYRHVGAGLSYDSMFLYGEVNGDWRTYRPSQRDWRQCPSACKPDMRGDGFCDPACNVEECDLDMGDCCEEDCRRRVEGVEMHKAYKCGSNGALPGGYECRGTAAGWYLHAHCSTHVGKRLLTQKPGGQLREQLDLKWTYKYEEEE